MYKYYKGFITTYIWMHIKKRNSAMPLKNRVMEWNGKLTKRTVILYVFLNFICICVYKYMKWEDQWQWWVNNECVGVFAKVSKVSILNAATK